MKLSNLHIEEPKESNKEKLSRFLLNCSLLEKLMSCIGGVEGAEIRRDESVEVKASLERKPIKAVAHKTPLSHSYSMPIIMSMNKVHNHLIPLLISVLASAIFVLTFKCNCINIFYHYTAQTFSFVALLIGVYLILRAHDKIQYWKSIFEKSDSKNTESVPIAEWELKCLVNPEKIFMGVLLTATSFGLLLALKDDGQASIGYVLSGFISWIIILMAFVVAIGFPFFRLWYLYKKLTYQYK